jgi:hypothetical protein
VIDTAPKTAHLSATQATQLPASKHQLSKATKNAPTQSSQTSTMASLTHKMLVGPKLDIKFRKNRSSGSKVIEI